MSNKENRELVSQIIKAADYDLWKELFKHPEDKREAKKQIEEMAELVRRSFWIDSIKAAAARAGWTKKAVRQTEWESYYEDYGDHLTPEEALFEDGKEAGL